MKPRSVFSKLIRGRKRGSALVAAMMFVLIFSMVVGYVMLASNRQTRNTYRARLFTTTLAASASIVKSMTQQAYYVARTRPAQVGADFDNLDKVISGITPKTVPNYIVVKDGSDELTNFRPTSDTNGDWVTITDPNHDWEGAYIRTWAYEAFAFVNAEDPENPGQVDVNAQRLGFEGAGFKATVEVNQIPLQQFAIFYDNDLEIHNGPDMKVMGPVHSNKTLWLATQDGLQFNDRVSAASAIRNYRDFQGKISGSTIPKLNLKDANIERNKESDADTHTGTIKIMDKNGNLVNLNNSGITGTTKDSNKNTYLDSLDNDRIANAMERVAGKLQDSAMGIKPILPPLPFVDGKQVGAEILIQRATNKPGDHMDKMEYLADVTIEGNPASIDSKTGELNDIQIKDSSGNNIPNKKVDGKKVTYIVTPGQFHDNRQNQIVKTFDVNIAELKQRSAALNSIASGNGLLYISTDPNAGGNLNAVRLTNAESMPKQAIRNTMTVATDRPMYLEGNVNSGTGNNRATLLLAADAITVTSQHLTLANTYKDNKPAKPTAATPPGGKTDGKWITNAIFMLGQVSSKYDNNKDRDHYVNGQLRSSMSGGAHNVLRYLENWDGVQHEFNGSLICLFESQIAKGAFWGRDYYNPPKRRYNWDADLRTKERPAGMPMLVEVQVPTIERISKAEAIELADK